MPTYNWIAQEKKTTNKVSGSIKADNENAVAEKLIGDGLIPISIELDTKAEIDFSIKKTTRKPTDHDIMMMCKQIHTLLKAGIPIIKTLQGLKDETDSLVLYNIIDGVEKKIISGEPISAAVASFPKYFDHFFVSMIKVGESTGNLDNSFLKLYEHFEFELFMKSQIKSALRYPTILIIAIAIAVSIINIAVIPKFAEIFAGFKTELPLMTRILIGTSKIFVSYWYLMILTIIVGVFSVKKYISSKKGKYTWDKFKLKLPIFGNIFLKSSLARFLRSFSISYKSGVPIVAALELSTQTTSNTYLSEKIASIQYNINQGDTITMAARKTNIFPGTVMQMLAAGEESGSLDTLITDIAEKYRQEVEYDIKSLGTYIEPIILFFMGCLVLVLALGVFLPIWDLGQAAMHKK